MRDSIAKDPRSQSGFEPDRLIAGRGFVMQRVKAAGVKHRPSRHHPVEPPEHFGIGEKSWCNHGMLLWARKTTRYSVLKALFRMALTVVRALCLRSRSGCRTP